jgi:hypothetical protein
VAILHLRSRLTYPTTSTARGRKSHRYNRKILLVAVFAAVAAGFPPGTPAWIQYDVLATANLLEYPQPDSVEVRLGRFPRVVITGKFRCDACSRPTNDTPVQTGTVAAMRFDAKTRRGTDFGLCNTRRDCLASLCGGGGCNRARDVLDSAFDELYARRVDLPFDHRVGHSRCGGRIAAATCSVAMTLTPRRSVVVFTETWRRGDRQREHVWRVIETRGAWVIRFLSTGDPPPRP